MKTEYSIIAFRNEAYIIPTDHIENIVDSLIINGEFKEVKIKELPLDITKQLMSFYGQDNPPKKIHLIRN